jgi:hypothetical protein
MAELIEDADAPARLRPQDKPPSFRPDRAASPGRSRVTERAASDAIRDLAADLFGIDRHWHKRVVRAGPNTLQPYDENPPDRIIADDDVVFCDFGPIFEGWEADFGRTFVLGDDPVKHRLRDDLPIVWRAGQDFFEAHPEVTGEQLFDHMVQLSERFGWEFGGTIAGHLVGEFPHVKIALAKICMSKPSIPPISRCVERTGQAGNATGSSRYTWSTGVARSAASTRSCSTSAGRHRQSMRELLLR